MKRHKPLKVVRNVSPLLNLQDHGQFVRTLILFSVWIWPVITSALTGFTIHIKSKKIMREYQFIGVDISKDSFEVFGLKSSQNSFSNQRKGFTSFSNKLSANSWVVMEASGPYFHPLACYLHHQGFRVSVINPLIIRRFIQMQMERTKTDKKDAFHIYSYANMQSDKLKVWIPDSEEMVTIRQMETLLVRYKKQRGSANTQLMSFQAAGKVSIEISDAVKKEVKLLDKQIKALEEKLEILITKSYPGLYENLKTIPGIGNKSASLLIIACRGFHNFNNHRQVISYLGLAPKIYQSGTLKGRSPICKMGMGHVRAVLYMAARAARKGNKVCKQLYERLVAKGKPHKVAMIAVVNKLIKQVFAIAKSGVAYQHDYVLSH